MKLVKDYNIWSNFIYFIAGIYSIIVGFSCKNNLIYSKLAFIFFGILLISNGVISTIYHQHTPSYKIDIKQKQSEYYQSYSEADKWVSMTSLIYSIIFFLSRCYIGDIIKILKDPMLYLTILFGIIALIFYTKANKHSEKSEECKNKKTCIRHNLLSYDLFHSNWHIFTGVSILFGITVIKNTYN